MGLEVLHDQDTREDTLVVAIEETADTGENAYTKNSQILDDTCWTGLAREGKATFQSRIGELSWMLGDRGLLPGRGEATGNVGRHIDQRVLEARNLL